MLFGFFICAIFAILGETRSSTSSSTTDASTTSISHLYCYVCSSPQLAYTSWSCDYGGQTYIDCSQVDPSYDQCITAYGIGTYDSYFYTYKFCGTNHVNGSSMNYLYVKYLDQWGSVRISGSYYASYTIETCNSHYCNYQIPSNPTTTTSTTESPSTTGISHLYCYVCSSPQFAYAPWSCDYGSQTYIDCSQVDPSYDQCITSYGINYYNGNFDTYKFCGTGYGNGTQASYLYLKYLDQWGSVRTSYSYSAAYTVEACNSNYCNYPIPSNPSSTSTTTMSPRTSSFTSRTTTLTTTSRSTTAASNEVKKKFEVVKKSFKTMSRFMSVLESMYDFLGTSKKRNDQL